MANEYNIGGENIPLAELEDFPIRKSTKPLLLLCKSGVRSRKAYTLLQGKGFKNLKMLKGGLNALSLDEH